MPNYFINYVICFYAVLSLLKVEFLLHAIFIIIITHANILWNIFTESNILGNDYYY